MMIPILQYSVCLLTTIQFLLLVEAQSPDQVGNTVDPFPTSPTCLDANNRSIACSILPSRTLVFTSATELSDDPWYSREHHESSQEASMLLPSIFPSSDSLPARYNAPTTSLSSSLSDATFMNPPNFHSTPVIAEQGILNVRPTTTNDAEQMPISSTLISSSSSDLMGTTRASSQMYFESVEPSVSSDRQLPSQYSPPTDSEESISKLPFTPPESTFTDRRNTESNSKTLYTVPTTSDQISSNPVTRAITQKSTDDHPTTLTDGPFTVTTSPNFTPIDITDGSTNTVKPITNTHYLLLVLKGNCVQDKNLTSYSNIQEALSIADHVVIRNFTCASDIVLNLTVSGSMEDVIKLLKIMRRKIRRGNYTMLLNGQSLSVIDVKQLDSNDPSVETSTKPFNSQNHGLLTKEVIAYIAVGSTFGIVLFIAFLICCVKCFRRKPSKTLEMDVIPHSNLKLEDYTLTRIPRPTSIYLDYYRGAQLSDHFAPVSNNRTPSAAEQGIVQPFDTSIVPLEDTQSIEDHRTTPGQLADHFAPPSAPPHRMKTFNGGITRNISYNDEMMCNSTERLHPHSPHEKNKGGLVNTSFLKY